MKGLLLLLVVYQFSDYHFLQRFNRLLPEVTTVSV